MSDELDSPLSIYVKLTFEIWQDRVECLLLHPMKAFRIFFIMVFAAIATSVSAQRRLVVADVETLLPIGGANVVCKDSSVVADSLGWFAVSDSTKTMVLSHVNYESRIVNLSEVRDTVYLISKLLSVEGVVVFGHGKQADKLKELKKRLSIDKTERELMTADPSRGTDLLKLLNYVTPRKWRKKSKQQKKAELREKLDEY